MDIVTIDFETYYDKDYSLSKITTEAYVRDPRFEVIGVGVKVNDHPADWYSGNDVKGFLTSLDYSDKAILCHNTAFDGAILSWHFGIRPRVWLDTLSMARPKHAMTVGGSLKALATYYQLGAKGEEVIHALGKRRADFSPTDLAAYGQYCCNDIELTYKLFKKLRKGFPISELELIDATIRMYTEPMIELNEGLLTDHLANVLAKKQVLMESLGGSGKDIIMSNEKFAKLLRKRGVDVPMKVSKATGKETYAFAKTDIAFLELQEHPDPVVQTLVAARLGLKSTLEETRTKAMIEVSQRGRLPIMLHYYGAHCVPGDTEVLTPDGWERLDVWGGGRVAQWYPDSGQIEFLNAESYVGPVIDQWVVSKAPYMPVDMTPGHTVPVLGHGKRALIPMSAAAMLSRSSSYVPTSGNLVCRKAFTSEQTRVLVMVQADGSFEIDSAKGRRLTIFLKKPRKVERARELLTAAGVKFVEQSYPSSPGYVRFVVRSRDYPEWLSPERKVFGPWVLRCPLDVFLDELKHWDGWVQGGQVCYSTSDLANAEWVQTAAHLSSMGCAMSMRKSTGNRRNNYSLRLRKRSECMVKLKHLSLVDKQQQAYCVKSKTGYWLARANGHIFVTGNTGRFSGGDKLNLQNLPARGNTTLRRALKAPKGHKIISCDSAQIEARVVAYLAGQSDLVQAFREKRDVYSEFATEIYGRKITKEDKPERFVGKTCLASGTRVLTQRGWVRIVDIQQSDLLWDGEEWVRHSGVSFMGVKQTISLSGVELTPDHEILLDSTQWAPALHVLTHDTAFQSALASANLPSSGTNVALGKAVHRLDGTQYAGATDVGQSLHTPAATYVPEDPLPAMSVPNGKRQRSGGGSTSLLWLTTPTEADCSTDCLLQSAGVTTPRTGCTTTMAGAGYTSSLNGDTTPQSFYGTYRAYPVGMTLREIWTASTTNEATNPAISGSRHAQRVRPTNDASLIWRPVFDILNSGSRNRFTILTDAGPMIAHNCILGLGYGLGAAKLRDALKRGQGDISVTVSEDEADEIIKIYRRKNHRIVGLWGECGYALKNLVAGRGGRIGTLLHYDAEGIHLPNGMMIRYPGLHARGTTQFAYIADERMYQRAVAKRLKGEPLSDPDDDLPPGMTRIYGGKVTENVVQALARIVVAEQLLKIRRAGYHVAFQVHDENVAVVKERVAAEAEATILDIMSEAPDWAPDLPVACEAGTADNYGDT